MAIIPRILLSMGIGLFVAIALAFFLTPDPTGPFPIQLAIGLAVIFVPTIFVGFTYGISTRNDGFDDNRSSE